MALGSVKLCLGGCHSISFIPILHVSLQMPLVALLHYSECRIFLAVTFTASVHDVVLQTSWSNNNLSNDKGSIYLLCSFVAPFHKYLEGSLKTSFIQTFRFSNCLWLNFKLTTMIKHGNHWRHRSNTQRMVFLALNQQQPSRIQNLYIGNMAYRWNLLTFLR